MEYDRGFLRWNDLNPKKMGKKNIHILDPILGSDPGSWQDVEHFSRNIGEVKERIESDMKRGCEQNNLEQK